MPHACPNFGCDKTYKYRSGLFTHSKICAYDDDVEEVFSPPRSIQKSTTMSSITKTDSDLVLEELDSFVQRTKIMTSFHKLKGQKKKDVQEIMGLTPSTLNINDLKLGMESARDYGNYYEYGIMYRHHQEDVRRDTIRKRNMFDLHEIQRAKKHRIQSESIVEDFVDGIGIDIDDDDDDDDKPASSFFDWLLFQLS
jgi:hypothetical protein